VSSYPILDEIARLLQEYYSPRRIVISGHTDNTGSDLDKIELSSSQAQAVTTYLWMNGIPLDLMEFYGMADKEDVGNFRSS
ncbi:OmpA family protein, partial [Acinetobacter baumannii]